MWRQTVKDWGHIPNLFDGILVEDNQFISLLSELEVEGVL